MSEPWRRPLKKWRFYISLSGKRVGEKNCSFGDFVLIACRCTCKGIASIFWMYSITFVQGSTSFRGRDALYAGGGKDGRLWTGKLSSQGKFMKVYPAFVSIPNWGRSGCTDILVLLYSSVPGIRVFLSSSQQDSTGTDVTLGSCLDGIIVKHKNGRPLVLFR